jgi:hypothetical protein
VAAVESQEQALPRVPPSPQGQTHLQHVGDEVDRVQPCEAVPPEFGFVHDLEGAGPTPVVSTTATAATGGRVLALPVAERHDEAA